MHRVRLIHWSAAEAEERAGLLRAAGWEVAHEPLNPGSRLRDLRENPPSAVVIDLSRLPMQGRDVGVALRHYQTTRSIPLIYVAGDPGKVARVRESLPDAVYTTWDRIHGALREAITNPPAVTAAPPRSLLAGYSGTPLAKKLGIKPHSIVALVDAPVGFEALLDELPEGAELRRVSEGARNLTLWFVRSHAELEGEIERMVPLAAQGPLWIAWPKKTSALRSDLTEGVVRSTGLAAGPRRLQSVRHRHDLVRAALHAPPFQVGRRSRKDHRLMTLRTRVGLRIAQAGGGLMMLGGAADLMIRSLLPSHAAFLGYLPNEIPPRTEALALALLHALGSALIASGLAVLALLRQARVSGRRAPALTAAAVALLAEGMNAFQIYRTGSPIFAGPLVFVVLVLSGVALCFIPRWELGSSA
jgi:hypothetical protein